MDSSLLSVDLFEAERPILGADEPPAAIWDPWVIRSDAETVEDHTSFASKNACAPLHDLRGASSGFCPKNIVQKWPLDLMIQLTLEDDKLLLGYWMPRRVAWGAYGE